MPPFTRRTFLRSPRTSLSAASAVSDFRKLIDDPTIDAIVVSNNGWRAYGARNELLQEGSSDSSKGQYVEHLLDCIKTRALPACDLETVGHRASVLCHAGNIAVRVGRTLTLDAESEMFRGDETANALCGRTEWRKPWTLPDV